MIEICRRATLEYDINQHKKESIQRLKQYVQTLRSHDLASIYQQSRCRMAPLLKPTDTSHLMF